MTEEQVVKIILTAVEKNFPKVCSCCSHRFQTYKDYLQDTFPLGEPLSNDAAIDDWRPETPLGFLSYSKCKSCTNTLTTNIGSLDKETIWQLLSWIKEEMKHRGVSNSAILNDIRAKMRQQVLGA